MWFQQMNLQHLLRGGGSPPFCVSHTYTVMPKNYIYSPTPYPKKKKTPVGGIVNQVHAEQLSKKNPPPPLVERLLSLDSNVPPNAILGGGTRSTTKPFKPLPTNWCIVTVYKKKKSGVVSRNAKVIKFKNIA